MDFSDLLEYEGISVYECSKRSGIPYSTLSDIIKRKTPIDNVSSKHLHALAKALDRTMDDLYSYMHIPERPSFETFKSNVCHAVKNLGDKRFIAETLEGGMIRKLYMWEWFPECLYLLAMLDYISKENGIDICADYDDLRERKLNEIVYPISVLTLCKYLGNDDAKKAALKNAIPEFLKYNIVEAEIRNVF